jgi:hypothetical protein
LPNSESNTIHPTCCCLRSLFADYAADAEPLASTTEALNRDAEMSDDFSALLSGQTEHRSACGFSGDGSPGSESELSEPDPPAFQTLCQKRVQEMGGNSGGLWR